jgi:glutamine amidotransferase
MVSQTIAIIDYGSGNLRSAAKAFSHVLAEERMPGEVMIASAPESLLKADRIVLPGQGAFGDCISGLKKIDGMVEALEEKVLKQAAPFFGICVGMQLLASRGLEFGEHDGLGWIDGTVKKMEPQDKSLKIPHMGWNEIFVQDENVHPVLQSVTESPAGNLPDFYFVHSFVFECKNPKHVLAVCDYGGEFAAIVGKDNYMGTQFHPEKSQKAGLQLISGFLRWKP